MDEMDEMDVSEYDDNDFDAKRRGSGARMYTLFRKRAFDYSFLATSGVATITIRRALKLPPFYYYWVGLRIHNRDISQSTASFALEFYPTLPSSEDPQEFSGSITSALTLSAGSTDTPPALKIVTTSNLGPYMKVLLRATQASAGSPLHLYAELSAVLLARPA